MKDQQIDQSVTAVYKLYFSRAVKQTNQTPLIHDECCLFWPFVISQLVMTRLGDMLFVLAVNGLLKLQFLLDTFFPSLVSVSTHVR